jgi:hypothetical protein
MVAYRCRSVPCQQRSIARAVGAVVASPAPVLQREVGETNHSRESRNGAVSGMWPVYTPPPLPRRPNFHANLNENNDLHSKIPSI